MGNMEYVDSMTVVGSNSRPSNDYSYFNNFSDDIHDETYLTDHYDNLKHILHDNYDKKESVSADDRIYYHRTKPSQNGINLNKGTLRSSQELLEDKIEALRGKVSRIENSYEWKFLTEPQKYPCTYQWKFQSSAMNMTATLKLNSIEDRDRLLSDKFDNNIPDIPKFNFNNTALFYKAVNRRVEIEDRNHLLVIKKQHLDATNEIQANVNELNQLKIAQSSVFAIPSPNVPTLSYGAGSNSPATQTANDNITKGFENTLGAIRDGLAETFDCSFGMSCSNDMDKAAKNPNIGKELTAEEKEALGILGSSISATPNGLEPDDERFKQQEIQTSNRKNEIKELFEYDNSRSGIQIGNRTLIEMPNKGNAKIFNGASEAEIKQYFVELTGNKTFPEVRTVPGKGNIYTVKTSNGSFNLRDFSSSASETGKAWTIDIPKGVAKDTAPVEIKFLK